MASKLKDQTVKEQGRLREKTVFQQLITCNSKHLLGKIYKMLLQYDTATEQVKIV